MPSQVEISKLSLAHVADAARINSIAPPDNSIQAQHCATFYPIARDECLEAFPWPFATTVRILAQSLITLPDGEWAYVYAIPDKYIRCLKIVPPGADKDHPGEDYVIRTDADELDLLVYTNCTEARMHYIYREEETGRYSPMFVSALSYLLGSYLAGPILKGRVGMQVKESLFRMFRNLIDGAAARQLGSGARLSQQYAGHKPTWITDR